MKKRPIDIKKYTRYALFLFCVFSIHLTHDLYFIQLELILN